MRLITGVENFRQDLRTLEASASEQAEAQLTQTEILQRIVQRRTFAPAQYHLLDTLTLLQEDRAR